MRDHHYLPARYYLQLAHCLEQWGMDLPGLLLDARVDPRDLQGPDAQMRLEQVERLVLLAATRSGRSDLGFELGLRLKLSSHDILGYAMLSAPSADQALRLVSRYFGLITPTFDLRYHFAGLEAVATVQPRLPMSPLVRQLHQEAIVVAFYEHVRTLLSGQVPDCRIDLPFDEPAHGGRYRELAGARVRFGQAPLGVAHIRLDSAQLLKPLLMADEQAVQMAESRCTALLQRITDDASLSEWVRMVLREVAEGQPTLAEIARMLNLSSRTLERRLQYEGQGFRELARRARFERACELLGAGRLSVTQVAYRLGYTDPANFTRAFRREAGIAPSRFKPPAMH